LIERVLGDVFEAIPLAQDSRRGSTSVLCSTNSGFETFQAAAEVSFLVTFRRHGVGQRFADILVEEVLVIERNGPSVSLTNTSG
jgi:hypothetical protein